MMNVQQACGVIAAQRSKNSLVIATMGAMRAFDLLEADSSHVDRAPKEARLSSVPLMGGAAGLGLGLALARPQRKVIVVDGDASLLMELSSLVTVAQAAPSNLLHLVIKNGTQFTGLANLDAPAQGFNFAQAARNAGYLHAYVIKDEATWEARFPEIQSLQGPVFVELIVEPAPSQATEGFEQAEMPDYQFERMGLEARAMQQLLNAEVA
ncbi:MULTISPECIES: thiamine pyrophosphate-dependent enzyme [Comamonas]|uniref:thiamine pyrophosphate-dependent enzyme n=2 Tax=Comamonadaceae TaxID=80864 RepID=UPI00054FDC81|nr:MULTISPECIES: thiamine pyrophosphate-dependent enzyme [Comamonas]MDN5536228.1 thiamine pyrophosphate-dependent enzyme [Comamonas sp.]